MTSKPKDPAKPKRARRPAGAKKAPPAAPRGRKRPQKAAPASPDAPAERPTSPSPAPQAPAPAEPPLSVPAPASVPEVRIERALDSRPRSSVPPASDPPSARLRALEDRLSRLTREEPPPEEDAPPASIRDHVTVAAREVVDRLTAPVSRVDETNVVDAVRELLSSEYYLRQWGRIGMRNRSEEVDDFGLDPVYEARFRPIAEFFYKRYFRVAAEGVENVPPTGRCLVVANHSGSLPLDGFMLRTCLRLEHPAARELRWLAEDYVYYLPFVGAFISRVGGVRACPENAERLLAQESLVGVFPEGVKGIGKLYRDRYKLQRFGRGGFIRLCLRTRTPLVPCAVVGAEEASPMLHRDELVSKLLGLPYLPITPTFPLLGPLGLLPAPTKWRIQFGEPVHFDEHDAEDADDPVKVGRLADRVRAGIQEMLDGTLSTRQSVWFG